MDNRFLEMDRYLKENCSGNGRSNPAGADVAVARRTAGGTGVASSQSYAWAQPFTARERVLAILIENGGVDLGIPELVDRLLSLFPAASLIPDSYRQKLVELIRDKVNGFTDHLLETVELSANRYTAAKPDWYGNVVILIDGTASYRDLKNLLLSSSRDGKIVDLFILTHGSENYISVAGGIDGQKIRNMKTENGKPLSIRSVYMMNCVGSSLNQAWIDAGAKVSSGALANNYLPEPTMYFFWQNWKDGQTFENAVTSAYRKTINLMNAAVRELVGTVPGLGSLAAGLDFATMDFVKASAPVIQGQRNVTITTDELSFTQTLSNSLATTVLPVDLLLSLRVSQAASNDQTSSGTLSPRGVDFIKQWEGFSDKMYNDEAGHCTVGYGTLLHHGQCDGRESEKPYAGGISKEKATELLTQEAQGFQKVINDKVKVALNQNQNDALVSFVYNVGDGAFAGSTLLKLLNQGKYDAVPTELKKWTKARQNGVLVDLPGLVNRRAAEAALFQTPVPAAAQSLSTFAKTPYARSLSIDYAIPGIVPVIAQPTPRTCWAAVFTMMYSWKTNTSIGIRNALAAVDARYADMFDRDIGLDADSARFLYAQAGLEPITSFNPTIDGWVSLLKQYGPLYVDVGYNVQNAGTHAIIVTGISGDGSPGNTSITYVDPIVGQSLALGFRDFLAKYEAQTAVQWPYTIVHWPAGAQKSIQSSLLTWRSHALA